MLKNFLQDNKLKQWPTKSADKEEALAFLTANIPDNKRYTEKEINTLLNELHLFHDPALLRRELFEHGLISRDRYGKEYWKTNPTSAAYEDPDVVSGYIKQHSNFTYPDHLLDTFLSHLPGTSILDLGCGRGRDVALFNSLGYSVTGLDLSSQMIRRAQELTYADPQPRFIQGSFHELTDLFAPESFSGILAAHSLLHLNKSEIENVLEGMHTILAPHGVTLISLKDGEGTHQVKEDKYGKSMTREFTYWKQEEFSNRMKSHSFDLVLAQTIPHPKEDVHLFIFRKI